MNAEEEKEGAAGDTMGRRCLWEDISQAVGYVEHTRNPTLGTDSEIE
jgi:hypothetical protein